MKLSSRAIVVFLLRFVVVYGLLIAPWPGWSAVYAGYFQGLGQLTFARESGRILVIFTSYHDPKHPIDTRVTLADRDQLDQHGNGPVSYLQLDARSIGWVPTALTLALILATPLSWRRRFWALLWGLFWVHAYILFSVGIWLWDVEATHALTTLTPFWKLIADGLEYTLITQMGTSFTIPVIIWILVTFRRQDHL